MGSNTDRAPAEVNAPRSYALSGKIMLTAIIILFAVVVFLVILHVYARWYLLRVRRRYLNRRRSRRHRANHLVFYVDPNNPNSTTEAVPARGLDKTALNSLPVFVYSSKPHQDHIECAVCLSEFEEDEKGRILPKCHHSFHTDCIDMWFHSHTTCPLCRSPVEPIPAQVPQNNHSDVVIAVGVPVEAEPGSSSGMFSTCQHDVDQSVTTSLAGRRKGLDIVGVTIDVARRNESDGELIMNSPSIQGFRSPGARLLSLKRLLSMNKKPASPSSGVGTSCGSVVVTESDLESGSHDPTQGQTGAQTPR